MWPYGLSTISGLGAEKDRKAVTVRYGVGKGPLCKQDSDKTAAIPAKQRATVSDKSSKRVTKERKGSENDRIN